MLFRSQLQAGEIINILENYRRITAPGSTECPIRQMGQILKAPQQRVEFLTFITNEDLKEKTNLSRQLEFLLFCEVLHLDPTNPLQQIELQVNFSTDKDLFLENERKVLLRYFTRKQKFPVPMIPQCVWAAEQRAHAKLSDKFFIISQKLQ